MNYTEYKVNEEGKPRLNEIKKEKSCSEKKIMVNKSTFHLNPQA